MFSKSVVKNLSVPFSILRPQSLAAIIKNRNVYGGDHIEKRNHIYCFNTKIPFRKIIFGRYFNYLGF